MANFFLGINRGAGQNPTFVTASAATMGLDFELRIDSGKNSTREDAVLAMSAFTQFMLSNGGAGANMPPK